VKYLLFAGANYYPSGGANDFIAAFDSVDAAQTHINENLSDVDWAHVASFDGQALVKVSERHDMGRNGYEWRPST
jgi:hypothetical protein